jgi:hypothetical protein
MKKSYVYFVAPLAALAVFAGVYWKYASEYDAKIETAEKARREKIVEKQRQENESKRAAVEAAIKSQDERKKAKALKEAKEQEEKDARDRSIQARNKAREDARKFADRVRVLEKDVDENKKEIAKIDQDNKELQNEQAFVREYVKKAQSNTQALSGVLERIAAADKAAEDAARLAAQEAAKKK